MIDTKTVTSLLIALAAALLLPHSSPVCADQTTLSQPGDTTTFSQHGEHVERLLDRMTLAEKIGQMTQAELGHLKDFREIRDLALGSVLSGGGSDPEAGNELLPWTNVYDKCQQQALDTRLGIPLLYGIDAVHGHSNVIGAVIFPHNIGLGCTRDPELIEEINRITALEVRATGINWTFSPCVTVPRDLRWGRTYEGFAEDPQLVGELGAAAVRGLQGDDLTNPQRILACAKHFVGDGGTEAERRRADWEEFSEEERLRLDQGDFRGDEATLRRIHLSPYYPALEAGVGTIMPSYSSWNGVKCSGNKYLLTDVLKGELGFQGFLISDYNAIDQITDDYKEAIKISTNAGMDMFMVPSKYAEFITLLTELVEEGEVSEHRIDDAVRRILHVKAAMGMFESGRSHLADRTLHEEFGSDEHRRVARDAVRKSLVLLKNEENLLPLSKNDRRILVAGHGADDLGIQCGGWTIEWQGATGEVTTGGTTILEAIRQAVGDNAKVNFSADGVSAEEADVAIMVASEPPYAEGEGDTENLRLSKEDREVLEKLHGTGIPVVLVVVSGRPLVLGKQLDQCQAIVAAWLPGTEGTGVADILFGDYAPTGKLSFTWPRTTDQEPINVGDDQYDPAFEYGFGLTYE